MPSSAPDGTLRYRGCSMEGTFCVGDGLTVESVSLAELHLGDVVIYRTLNGQGETVELVHRIVGVVPGGLVAQGDSNPCPDPGLVTAENLVGRVTHVERGGRTRSVSGGWLGLLRVRFLHAWHPLCELARRIGRRPYRWLRRSGLVSRLWRPAVTVVSLSAEDGPLVKYICGGRTVARWWPTRDHFECRKPYDLVILPPDRDRT